MEIKHVKRLSDGAIIDVPADHWSLSSPDYEEVKPEKPKAKKAPKKASK